MSDGNRIKETVAATPDELDVLKLVARGYTDLAIARRLNMSVVTVRRRATHLRAKVGARTRAEAVAIAVSLGWFKHPVAESQPLRPTPTGPGG